MWKRLHLGYSCKNGDSVIMGNAIIDAEETKTNPRNIISETKSFYILLAFLLITIALWIAFSIYFYLVKCKAT